jgi:hypothetical protein
MKKYILIFIIAVFSFQACSDYLEEENKTQYSSEYVYGSPEGLKLAVSALYDLQKDYMSDDESSTMWALERGTDIVMTNGGTGNFFGIYDPNYLKPSASQVLKRWKTMYQIIGRCNEIIYAAENMKDTSAVKVSEAEAKCFRAQSYFLLFRTYDRIWLNTEPVTPENVNEKRDYHPATQSEVFKLLYDDLGYAIKNLDWTSYQPGRFNQAAARHILAKVALWKKDWQTALDQVDSIDANGNYALMDTPAEVFNAADLNHKEALLVQQWSENPGGNFSTTTPKGHSLAALFIASSRQALGGTNEEACSVDNWGYTYGRCLPNPYLLSLYDQAKDKRFNEYFIQRYKNTKKTDVIYGSVTVHPGEYLPATKDGKVDRYNLPGCTKQGDIWTRAVYETRGFKDFIVYRLADTYIVGAEAALRLNNQTKAKYYYNKTWQRAGNDAFTGTLKMQDIIDEEAREMCFEDDRWYFLKRLGLLIDQVKAHAGNDGYPASLLGRTNLPANPRFIRWPIPESEVINMGAENFPQNIGY